MYFVYACGKDDVAGPSSFQCEVTLTLVPSRIGDLSSPSGTGRGTGAGATEQEALNAAYRSACSQQNLSSDLRSRCESGQDFGVAVTSNGVNAHQRRGKVPEVFRVDVELIIIGCQCPVRTPASRQRPTGRGMSGILYKSR